MDPLLVPHHSTLFELPLLDIRPSLDAHQLLDGASADARHSLTIDKGSSFFSTGAWEAVTSYSLVLEVVCNGYRIPFVESPPLSTRCLPSPIGGYELLPHEATLLERHVMEEVVDSSPGYFSRMLLVPKPDGTKRWILDL